MIFMKLPWILEEPKFKLNPRDKKPKGHKID
jgi:hypothetical protein